jgi:hypothetical protein
VPRAAVHLGDLGARAVLDEPEPVVALGPRLVVLRAAGLEVGLRCTPLGLNPVPVPVPVPGFGPALLCLGRLSVSRLSIEVLFLRAVAALPMLALRMLVPDALAPDVGSPDVAPLMCRLCGRVGSADVLGCREFGCFSCEAANWVLAGFVVEFLAVGCVVARPESSDLWLLNLGSLGL